MYAINWGAILAGMAVGIAVHLVLTLIGTALGLAMLDPRDAVGIVSREGIPFAAAGYHVASMAIGALVGGYVAGRASGLRRAGDGALHGVVAWGATTLTFAIVALTSLSSLFGGLFGMVAPLAQRMIEMPVLRTPAAQSPAGAMGGVLDALRNGDRDEATRRLREQTSLGEEDAKRYIDLAGALIGRDDRGSGQELAARAERAADLAAAASGWVAASMVVSLVLGAVGGMSGARSARRTLRNRGPLRPKPLPS